MLTSIILGLGGAIGTAGRGSKKASVIKHGKPQADVVIELYNEGTPPTSTPLPTSFTSRLHLVFLARACSPSNQDGWWLTPRERAHLSHLLHPGSDAYKPELYGTLITVETTIRHTHTDIKLKGTLQKKAISSSKKDLQEITDQVGTKKQKIKDGCVPIGPPSPLLCYANQRLPFDCFVRTATHRSSCQFSPIGCLLNDRSSGSGSPAL